MGESIISRTLDNNEVEVVQEVGASTTDVMSQKAVTDELNNKVDKVEGKGLSSEDFTAEDKERLDNAVPQTRTINSKSLSDDVVLTAEDVGALPISFSDHTHSADSIVSGSVSISRGGTGATTAEGARSNLNVYSKSEVDSKISASNLGKLLYPVGAIYMSVNSTNPQNLFGGTWVSWGTGRVPIGINTSDDDFKTVEKTGGSKSHEHLLDGTGAAMIGSDQGVPSTFAYAATNIGVKTGTMYTVQGTQVTKQSQRAHNTSLSGWTNGTKTLPPYITCYMWKRTA